jgi:ankyrin repeat protein
MSNELKKNIRTGNLVGVKELHQQDRTLIGARYLWRRTPLHWASYHGHLDVVKWLHEQIPKLISARDLDGWTPLHLASSFGHLDVLQWLLSKQPSLLNDVKSRRWIKQLNLRTKFPLHFAARDGNLDMVISILREEPHRIQEKDIWDMTPLHHAMECSNRESAYRSVYFLLEKDFSVINRVDNQERDAYDIALECDSEDDVFELIQLYLIRFLSAVLLDD